MNELSIDRYDLALLAALQRDGQATNAALGERAALSASQISRRIQRLEEAKLITGYAALLDAAALGLGVTAFAHVLLERHDHTRPAEFERQIAALPEV
ncbi:MAG TPA: Lrp/AsnC family transcriptional regulator, partial [Burkholderiaceae bacterium]|nr:Lrp/AsnC family transcriptional regulator [Burkholderiaceae bacterium]